MSNCIHPLQHYGTAQTDRLLKALMPSGVCLDPRDQEELMVFAARFAGTVKYWKSENDQLIPDGDWTAFWECDHLFFLALVASFDVEALERRFKQAVVRALENAGKARPEDECDPETCPVDMRALVDMLYQMASMMNEWGEKAKVYPALQRDFAAAVRNELAVLLPNIILYDKDTPPKTSDYDPFITDCSPFEFASNWNLSKTQYIKNDALDPCLEPYVSIRKMQTIASRFLAVLARIRMLAARYLAEEQSGIDKTHQPHIALFFAFLHLFRHLQQQLNGLTQQHLDHYYQRILHLERRKQAPDYAHLVFQLAQGVVRHTLDAGTLFRGGKDTDGKDLFYTLTRPLSLNTAQVAEIQTVYVEGNDAVAGPPQVVVNSIPVAVYEEIILDTDKENAVPDKMAQVRPFYALGHPGDSENLAPLGFAIESAQLDLARANRLIDVKFELSFENQQLQAFGITPAIFKAFWKKIIGNEITPETDFLISNGDWETNYSTITSNLKKLFLIEISTEKGWEQIDLAGIGINQPFLFPGYTTNSRESIAADAGFDDTTLKTAAINLQSTDTGFTANLLIHFGKKYASIAPPKNGGFGTFPVLKVTFKPEYEFDTDEYKFVFSVLKAFSVQRITITTRSTGLSNVIFKNPASQITFPGNTIDLAALSNKSLDIHAPEIFKKAIINSSNILPEVDNDKIKEVGTAIDTINGVVRKVNLDNTSKASIIDVLKEKPDSSLNESIEENDLKVLNSAITILKGSAITTPKGRPHGYNDYIRFQISSLQGFNIAGAGNYFLRNGNPEPVEINSGLISTLNSFRDLEGGDNVLRLKFVVPDNPPNEIFTIEVDYQSTQVIYESEPTANIYSQTHNTSLLRLEQRADDNIDSYYYGSGSHFWKIYDLHDDESATREISEEEQVDITVKKPFPLFPQEAKYPVFLRPKPIKQLGNDWANGNLLVGFRQLQIQQSVSLLFQVADGSEEKYEFDTPDIEWSYLFRDPVSGEEGWKRFPSSAIRFDSTKADEASQKSLVQSGIVELALPADAYDQSPMLKPGFYWIRASAMEDYNGESQQLTSVLALPKLIAVHAQAGRVQLATDPAAAVHFARPVPPETITQLKLREAEVRKIEQPYQGFGGRPAEPDMEFYRRISERLRHRGRAITLWDYERLVLEYFPEVRAVKCLNHTYRDDTCANGHVTVVVLPYLRNPEYQNPLQPQPAVALLERVKGYLRPRVNMFVAAIAEAPEDLEYLHIERPDYVQVAVHVKVCFKPGFADDDTLIMRLDDDIAKYIAPWAYDQSVAPRFGASLYRTELLCHLENLDYVDFIADLKIGVFTTSPDDEMKQILKIDPVTKLVGTAKITAADWLIDFTSNREVGKIQFKQVITPQKSRGILTSFARPDVHQVFTTVLDEKDLTKKEDDEIVAKELPLKDDYTPNHLIELTSNDE